MYSDVIDAWPCDSDVVMTWCHAECECLSDRVGSPKLEGSGTVSPECTDSVDLIVSAGSLSTVMVWTSCVSGSDLSVVCRVGSVLVGSV